MRVRETMMADGDVIHYWNTADDVRNSGRLDFVFEQMELPQELANHPLIDNNSYCYDEDFAIAVGEAYLEYKQRRFESIDDVEQLVKEFAPSYIFIVED